MHLHEKFYVQVFSPGTFGAFPYTCWLGCLLIAPQCGWDFYFQQPEGCPHEGASPTNDDWSNRTAVNTQKPKVPVEKPKSLTVTHNECSKILQVKATRGEETTGAQVQ